MYGVYVGRVGKCGEYGQNTLYEVLKIDKNTFFKSKTQILTGYIL